MTHSDGDTPPVTSSPLVRKARSQTTRGGLALALVALAASTARANDWSSFGLDGALSRLSGERSGAGFGPARWEHTLPPVKDAVYRALLASPSVADGFMVYGTFGNVVRGVRETDGRTIWEVRTNDAVYATPAIARGWAYVASLDRHVYAIRLIDGGVVWKLDTGGVAYASPTIVGDSVFVSTGAPMPRLLRIDAETGKVRWQTDDRVLHQASYASPAVAGGHVVVGEVGGRYVSFSVEDGSMQWSADTGGEVNMSSPLIVGSRVYLFPGGPSARLHALDLADGKPVTDWPVEVTVPDIHKGHLLNRSFVPSSPAIAGTTVIFGFRVEDRVDTNADDVVDTYAQHEHTAAVDSTTGKLLWVVPNGTRISSDPNDLPMYGFCSTPAVFTGTSGQSLVAVASSLVSTLRVLDATTGAERWTLQTAAPTRGSPVMANGRLVVGTDAGVIHSFVSQANRPPLTPGLGMFPVGGQDVDAVAASLRWVPTPDPDGDPVTYQVRLDGDGEILHDWIFDVPTKNGQASLDVTVPLVPGRVYTYSVRARDSKGAYSIWSAPESFRALATPSVQIGNTPMSSLAEALAMAKAGDTIKLGAGVFPLSSTARLGAGVSLTGAAPHLTTLVGKGLAVAISAGGSNRIGQLTVAQAAVGIEATGNEEVRLENIILRDNGDAGLVVRAGATARLWTSTVVRNGAGVRAEGTADVKNAIVTMNAIGIDATRGAVTTRFNDVFANRTSDYEGAQRTATDLAERVTFSGDDSELRLKPGQPTTDRGDPADDYSNEPAPNGGRINLGAFGNTPFAELSSELLEPGPPPPPPGDKITAKSRKGLCSLAGADGTPDGAVILVGLVLAFGLRRRRVPRA